MPVIPRSLCPCGLGLERSLRAAGRWLYPTPPPSSTGSTPLSSLRHARFTLSRLPTCVFDTSVAYHTRTGTIPPLLPPSSPCSIVTCLPEWYHNTHTPTFPPHDHLVGTAGCPSWPYHLFAILSLFLLSFPRPLFPSHSLSLCCSVWHFSCFFPSLVTMSIIFSRYVQFSYFIKKQYCIFNSTHLFILLHN